MCRWQAVGVPNQGVDLVIEPGETEVRVKRLSVNRWSSATANHQNSLLAIGSGQRRCRGRLGCSSVPLLRGAGVPGGGPWIQRLANPPARVQVPRQRPGWSSGIQGAVARPIAGWRSSSLPPSGGAGTTGTGVVRGRTRRPTAPAAACGRDQQSRGRGSPWLPCPVRPGGLGVRYLVWDDSGAL